MLIFRAFCHWINYIFQSKNIEKASIHYKHQVSDMYLLIGLKQIMLTLNYYLHTFLLKLQRTRDTKIRKASHCLIQ